MLFLEKTVDFLSIHVDIGLRVSRYLGFGNRSASSGSFFRAWVGALISVTPRCANTLTPLATTVTIGYDHGYKQY